MVNNAQVVRIVSDVIRDRNLDSRHADELRAWARRWNSAWTSEREYTARAVSVMTNNAAAYIAGAR